MAEYTSPAHPNEQFLEMLFFFPHNGKCHTVKRYYEILELQKQPEIYLGNHNSITVQRNVASFGTGSRFLPEMLKKLYGPPCHPHFSVIVIVILYHTFVHTAVSMIVYSHIYVYILPPMIIKAPLLSGTVLSNYKYDLTFWDINIYLHFPDETTDI